MLQQTARVERVPQVVARRALQRWLYAQLQAAAAAQERQPTRHAATQAPCSATSRDCSDNWTCSLELQQRVSVMQSWQPPELDAASPLHAEACGPGPCTLRFQRASDVSGRFSKRGDWHLCMFISQPPCGDACLLPGMAHAHNIRAPCMAARQLCLRCPFCTRLRAGSHC